MNRNLFALSLGAYLFIGVSLSSPLEASPVSVSASKVQADTLLKQNRLDAAISLYEEVLAKDPAFANAYYNLATAYYLRGEVKKALENLERFVELRPYHGEALYNLGCLKLRMGAFDAASECFRRAQEGSASQELGQKIRQALQFLKGLSQPPSPSSLPSHLLLKENHGLGPKRRAGSFLQDSFR